MRATGIGVGRCFPWARLGEATDRTLAVNGAFVTGTDTGVGKTLVSTALVLGHAKRG